jgi:hypothetical protein
VLSETCSNSKDSDAGDEGEVESVELNVEQLVVEASGSALCSEGSRGTKVSTDLLSKGDPRTEKVDMRVWRTKSSSYSTGARE